MANAVHNIDGTPFANREDELAQVHNQLVRIKALMFCSNFLQNEINSVQKREIQSAIQVVSETAYDMIDKATHQMDKALILPRS